MRRLMLAYAYWDNGTEVARTFLDTDDAITEANIQRWEEAIAHSQDLDPVTVTIIAVTVVESEEVEPYERH
jgi:hypothetical protein